MALRGIALVQDREHLAVMIGFYNAQVVSVRFNLSWADVEWLHDQFAEALDNHRHGVVPAQSPQLLIGDGGVKVTIT